jgi:hypothetical protein
VLKYKNFLSYQNSDIGASMETAPPDTETAVTGFVLGQLRRLSDEAGRLERMARESGGQPVAGAMDRLRHRLAAHVVVEERLFIGPLRGSHAHETLRALRSEHDLLEHRAAEIQARGCPPSDVAALGRTLRAHIEEESRLVRSASAQAEQRLSEIPPWRADELFERAGGPTETWPGEWLG